MTTYSVEHAERGRSASSVASRGRTVNEQETWHVPLIDRIGYDRFLSMLVKKHGEDYLRRPDGEPLHYVDPSGIPRGEVAITTGYRATRVKRPPSQWQLPNSYTGNAQDDIHLQMRDRTIGLAYGEGFTIIAESLARGMKTNYEIAQDTGLSYEYVRNALEKYAGKRWELTDIKAPGRRSHYWKLIEGEREPQPAQAEEEKGKDINVRGRVLRAVRIRPMMLREIADCTGLTKNQVKACLTRYHGTYFRCNEHVWEEIKNVLE